MHWFWRGQDTETATPRREGRKVGSWTYYGAGQPLGLSARVTTTAVLLVTLPGAALAALVADDPTASLAVAVVVLPTAFFARVVASGVYARADSVVVSSILGTRKLRWDGIAGFGYEAGLPVARLTDGGRVVLAGVAQVTGHDPDRGQRMLEELNEMLAANSTRLHVAPELRVDTQHRQTA